MTRKTMLLQGAVVPDDVESVMVWGALAAYVAVKLHPYVVVGWSKNNK